MKTIWNAAVAVVVATLLVAAVPAHAQDLKIAIIDFEALKVQTKVGQEAVAKVEAKRKESQEQLDDIQSGVKELIADYQKRQMVLSEAERKAAEEKIEREGRDIQRKREDLERELQRYEAEQGKTALIHLAKAIHDYGEAHDYDLILPRGIVLYHSGVSEVTDEAMKFADSLYKK